MADFPEIGGSENTWGDELKAFFERQFNMSGTTGGTLATLCYEGDILTYEDELLIYVEN